MDSATLLTHLIRQLGHRRHLLVAFSGGLDSTVLLQALVMLKRQHCADLQLRAAHIHHGLSKNASAWGEHCRDWCQRWQVPLQIIEVRIDATAKGIEAGARQARYQALAQQLRPMECLVTAQHLDDQSETFLLALKRGSGPTGLAGMVEQVRFADGELLRPLLAISRRQLANYALQQGLSWIEDESNQDLRFDRNFLRLQILPLLTDRWPHFSDAVARSAGLCAQQEALLNELLAESLAALIDAQGAICISGLANVSVIKRNALLRRWIAQAGGDMPSHAQLLRLWDEVAMSRQDAEPHLILGQRQIRRFHDNLYLLPLMQRVRDWRADWDGSDVLELPDNLGRLVPSTQGMVIRAPQVFEQVSVRFCAAGEIRIVGRRHGRRIKKIWQELMIPPWQRDRIPLIYFNEQLIAAVGVFITYEGQAEKNQPVWQIEWIHA